MSKEPTTELRKAGFNDFAQSQSRMHRASGPVREAVAMSLVDVDFDALEQRYMALMEDWYNSGLRAGDNTPREYEFDTDEID